MDMPKTLAALVLVVALAGGTTPLDAVPQAQTEPADQPPPAPPTFGVATGAVAIDVVVRDKKGRLVKDLTAEDFEVYEDGERQPIETFAVIARGVEALREPGAVEETLPAPAPPVGRAPVETPAPRPETADVDTPSVLALVFDRMSTEGRDLARKAALTYLSARQVGDYVGVFSIDLALHALANFTDDTERIRLAIERAGAQAATPFTSSRDQATALQTLEGRARDATAAAATAPVGGGPGAAGEIGAAQALAAGASVERDIMQITVNMLRSFEALERDQQGLATANGLLSLVQGLQGVPGRKTVVFFSEGMAIPDRVLVQFQSVIAAANRANVAIYTMDAGGLRTLSPTEETRRELNAMNESRFRNLGREDEVGIMLREAERNEDLLRLNPHAGLGRLADETGGFLIRDTNDAREGFRQIAQDMRFHYVLGYTPTNQEQDGRFRRVSVKVARSGIDVQSRQGYFALRTGGSAPVRAYEAPALAVLDRPAPQPEAFPLRAVALTFPESASQAKVPVLVEVPGHAIEYVPDPSRNDMMSADLRVLVRLRNEYQQEVARFSEHYLLASPTEKVDAARSGNILFYREAELPPGAYTVDVVAYDAITTRASVKSFPLEVGGAGGAGTQLSSLVLIDHVERVPAAERDPSNPLYFGEALLYPNMGDPYRKSAASALGFYFTARTPATAGKALLEVAQDGKVTGSLTMNLPAPDAEGRIQHAGTLPLAGFAPGSYVLRVSLLDGPARVAASAARFSVAE